jgi:hypothetical protein
MLRNGSHFDQTKFRLSVNNVFNHRGIVGVSPVATAVATANPVSTDQLSLLPGRSISFTVTVGISPKK